ncbi:MAG: DoxX-like family protein [Bacteroidota bacterium]
MVWLVNGLLAKVLNLVPRHQEIVERILGAQYAREFIVLIGCAEIVLAIWVFSRWKYKLSSILQIAAVIAMNILEFFLAPDLLLWGSLNFFFALSFSLLVYYHGFILTPKYKTIARS